MNTNGEQELNNRSYTSQRKMIIWLLPIPF
jgi:hypothetical protein